MRLVLNKDPIRAELLVPMTRPSATRQVTLAAERLDPEATTPLYRQVYDALRADILGGHLPPGQRLAASRVLAADLGVSRNTVSAAIEQLVAEGYLTSRVGAGTFVAPALPEEALRGIAGAEDGREPERGDDATEGSTMVASSRARRVAEHLASRLFPKDVHRLLPFRPGLPDVGTFPVEEWARLSAQTLREAPPRLFDYGEPQGFGPLREAVAGYLREARGVLCGPQQVVIVSGSQQGLYLSAKVLADEGEKAWVEDPGYRGARAALNAVGVEAVPVPIDGEGLCVEQALAEAAGARLAIVTPSHQFPLGVCMSLGRRLQLLDWAHRTGSWIIEDDYDSEFRYSGRPIESLASLDAGGRVIYVGTLSKVLAPALRLGYLVVPEPLVPAFAAARFAVDRHGAVVEQAVAARFIAAGRFLRHLRRTRIVYGHRQRVLVEAIQESLRDRLDVASSPAGLHLLARLKSGVDEEEAVGVGAEANVVIVPLGSYRTRWPQPPALVLGYAPFAEQALRRAAVRLAEGFKARLG